MPTSGYSITHDDSLSSYSNKSCMRCSKWRACCTVCALFLIVLSVVGGLLLAAFVRALTLKVPEYVDESKMLQILQQPNMSSENFLKLPLILGTSLTFPTITNSTGNYDPDVFQQFWNHLKNTFTNVFTSEVVQMEESFPSFLLTVQGSNINSSVGSFLLLAHLDVVPVEEESWTGDPFSGEYRKEEDDDGGYVYGRGAIDDKLSVVAILCALDELLGSGWTPNITFYIAFGHDEEVGGLQGAARLASLLEAKGVRDLFFILDEGMPIVEGVISGVDVPVATIGVTEKGWIDVEVSASGVAGHSSIPPHQQATHALASALHRLHGDPQPAMMGTGPEEDMLIAIAPKSSWPVRLVLSNTWLFRPLISAVLASGRETDAMQRTTTATTIIRAGVKDNVVPGTAWALINHRVHPGQTLDEVVQHDIDAIADELINVTVVGSREAHPVSPYGPDAPAFSLIAATVQKFYPDAVPAPSLLLANTDTRHYLQFSDSVYRFMPYQLTPQDIAGIHGHNERVSAGNVWRAAQFFHSLILSADMGEWQGEAGSSDVSSPGREL